MREITPQALRSATKWRIRIAVAFAVTITHRTEMRLGGGLRQDKHNKRGNKNIFTSKQFTGRA